MLSPYVFGWLALAILYAVSIVVTRSGWPWALARGHQNKLSASLLQFLVFTAVTIFAYVTTVAARVLSLQPGAPLPPLPEIPINLLLLMGLSVVTAAGSRGLTVSYLQKGEIPSQDRGNLFENREGATDLTKAQMLIWTLIAAVIYLVGFSRFVAAKCYLPEALRPGAAAPAASAQCPEGYALPDVDGALLVLMGVSQGGYVAGKLVSRQVGPKIEHLLPTKAKADEDVSIYGLALGASKEGNSIIFEGASGAMDEVPPDKISEWTDGKVRFSVPDRFAPAAKKPANQYTVRIRVSSQTVVAGVLEVSA